MRAATALPPRSGICTYPGQDPELWFPGDGKDGRKQARAAVELCLVCHALKACQEWALANEPGAGIFGGLSEKERNRLRNRRGVA